MQRLNPVVWAVLLLLLVTCCIRLSAVLLRQTDSGQDVTKIIGEEMQYFPVPQSLCDTGHWSVTYTDSYEMPRTYGGNRVHEGCDIMAGVNKRGHYPVISTSDGYVEKTGWLKLGGYRIGIRSPGGIYFYYAHLNDYAKDFQPGEPVLAGQLLGFMGDTGYGETEGTRGLFPVHLHFGIYVTDDTGTEKSINPYPYLSDVADRRLKYAYE